MQSRVQAECATQSHRASFQLTEDLIRRHQSGVWRYLRFLGCPPELADDLTQEAKLQRISDLIPNCTFIFDND